jgi:hypothetical protein
LFIIIKKKRIEAIFAAILFIVGLYLSTRYNFFYINKDSPSHVLKSKPDYLIIIYIDEKKLYLFEDEKCIKKYPIASGKPGWPSPLGEWKIINKGEWGEGFGGHWLGLNVKWGNYGIHGTTNQGSIGRSASHGCIRMFNKDIKELYDIVHIGTPVIIKNGTFGPFGTGFKELKPGDRGADVLAVQQRLKALGYFKGYESGIYEDNLKHALHKFQADNKLTVKDVITRTDYTAMGFREFE